MRELMAHQQQALDWSKDRDAVAFFMEMRLGKTAVSIRWARQSMGGIPSRTLVVAPLTTLDGWRRELRAEGVLADEIVMLAGVDARERVRRAVEFTGQWFLINYEGVRLWPGIGLLPWDAVILDESTRIKNPQAQVTKVVTRKLFDVKHRAILTGLPNPEGSLNYFSQMQFINGGTFMGFSNFWSFREALFMQIGYDWVPRRAKDGKPGTRQRIKKAVGELAFVMTRKEAGVGSKLVTERRTVPMNADQRKAHKEIKSHFRFGELETKFAGTQHVWMQRVAGGFSPDRANPAVMSDAKLREILALLTGELKGEPLVVWFHFNEELAYVYHALKDKGYSVMALLGATPLEKRFDRLAKFQKGRFQIFCIQEALGQFGLDLSRADTEIYYSNAWSLELRNQSQDRLVHPKKKVPLLAIDLVTEGSTDEDVVETLMDKSIDARSFSSRLLERVNARFGKAA